MGSNYANKHKTQHHRVLHSFHEQAHSHWYCDAPKSADRFPRSFDGSFKASEGFPTHSPTAKHVKIPIAK